jgi:hypothetical protein
MIPGIWAIVRVIEASRAAAAPAESKAGVTESRVTSSAGVLVQSR